MAVTALQRNENEEQRELNMETRILSTSIVRGLLVLSLGSIVACSGGHQGSPLQPTLASPATGEPVSAAPAPGTAGVSDASLPQSLIAPTLADYTFHTYTCNKADSGTDANIYIKVTGSLGSTGWILLDNYNHNDFEKGQYD